MLQNFIMELTLIDSFLKFELVPFSLLYFKSKLFKERYIDKKFLNQLTKFDYPNNINY